MSNFWGHFHTITTHKLRVMKYCFKVGLYRQGLLHDLSKYAPIEFLPGVRYYQGNRSPNEMERLEKGYSAAWLHHKGRNRHHLEYWIDACQIYQKEKYTDASPWNYYAKSLDHYIIHPGTQALLEKLLLMLRDEGEKKTIAYIRREILKNG